MTEFSFLVLIPAIFLEVFSTQRLRAFLLLLPRKKNYPSSSLHAFISFVSILSLSLFASLHALAAFSELLHTSFATKIITINLLCALISFASLTAIFLSQQLAIHRQLSLSLLASISILPITFSQNDIFFFFLGVEIANLPFLLILFRSPIAQINLLSHTIHHFSGFFFALSSIILIVLSQDINVSSTLSFDLYSHPSIPKPILITAIILLLASPLSRTFIPFFHVGLRIIKTSPPTISFSVVSISSLINILFFLSLHDKIFAYISFHTPHTIIILTSTLIIALSTFLPAAFTLISTSNISTLAYTASSILHAQLIIILALSENANRFAFVCQFFITSSLTSIIFSILDTRLQRHGHSIRQFSDFQGVAQYHPKLSFLLVFSLFSVFAFPLSFNFPSQIFFTAIETANTLFLPLHNPYVLIPILILSSLVIPQSIAISKLLLQLFSPPLADPSLETPPRTFISNLLLILSSFLLIVLPFLFGTYSIS